MKCQCGKRMSKYVTECNSCYEIKHNALMLHNKAIVNTGKCPQCNKPLKRNLALFGWWQCSQFGSEHYRIEPEKPSCSFQIFTE